MTDLAEPGLPFDAAVQQRARGTVAGTSVIAVALQRRAIGQLFSVRRTERHWLALWAEVAIVLGIVNESSIGHLALIDGQLISQILGNWLSQVFANGRIVRRGDSGYGLSLEDALRTRVIKYGSWWNLMANHYFRLYII